MTGDVVLWNGEAAALGRWTSHAAPGSDATVAAEPGVPSSGLRFDFSLVGPRGWAIARLEVSASLPEHYVVMLRLRGQASRNELQLKLVDPSAANVWWWRRDLALTRKTETLVLRKASLEFAWGPASGGEPRDIGAVEIALAAGEGGSGTIWIEEIRVEARDPACTRPSIHALTASSCAAGSEPERLHLGDEPSIWQPDPTDSMPWIQIDLGHRCEWGGAVVDFGGAGAPASRLLGSDDGEHWKLLAQTPAGAGHRIWLRTAEGEGRFARVELHSDDPLVVTRVAVVPLELAVSPARYAMAVALPQRRGLFPQHIIGEHAYWAVVGADGDERKGLLSENGALEVDAQSFSIEPFLWVDGRLVTWADVQLHPSLADGFLPIPSLEWEMTGLRLRITAFADGAPGQSTLVARYEIENRGAAPCRLRLFLAIRPFQVNPAWQSLNVVGGIAPIRRLERLGETVRVNEEHAVVAAARADAFGAAMTEEGLRALTNGRVPSQERVDDPIGFAEGALAYDLELEAGACAVVALAVPLHEASAVPISGLARSEAAAWVDARLAETAAYWRTRLAAVPIELPGCADAFATSLRASIAWILVNREGARIQPGPRCYRRSWIRDGALTGASLAEMGFADEPRAFLRWYAPHQLEDGRVPCAVDRSGVDLVEEHDSHGQLIWGVVEVFRLTGDESFLRELWPHLERAVDAIETLRAHRTKPELRGQACYGLLPESISHEGYSSRPVHSFWDDFFAVRGLSDAAEAAAVLGDVAASRRIMALRDAMRADLRASIARTIADHGIDFVPGSVELGDFDPTSTAIALDPCDVSELLPAAALERTFELYWKEFDSRRRGEPTAESYTAYEVRNAPALAMLGYKERAIELLRWLIEDQRPAPWRQWPEVTTRDPRAPRFLGDLPHGWIASSFVRALRRMVAYERARDGALVLASGVPAAWVQEAPGLRVRALPTYHGLLDYTMRAGAGGCVVVTFGDGLRWPRGGVVVHSPFEAALRGVVIDGERTTVSDPRRATLARPAAELLLEY